MDFFKTTLLIHLTYKTLDKRKQPCKSKHSDVVVTFTLLYKTIDKNMIEPLQNNFQKVSGPKQPTSPRTASLELTNRFTPLAATSNVEAASS